VSCGPDCRLRSHARSKAVALQKQRQPLAPIRKALAGWPLVIPERTTFYGAREIIVRDPANNVVAFASRET